MKKMDKTIQGVDLYVKGGVCMTTRKAYCTVQISLIPNDEKWAVRNAFRMMTAYMNVY